MTADLTFMIFQQQETRAALEVSDEESLRIS